MEQTNTLPGIELEPHAAAAAPPAAEEDLAGRERRFKPIDRVQQVLHPVEVEGLVAEDDAVRAIWELVGDLDLSRYQERVRAVEERAGRPATNPRLLASLWIYAYSQGVSSAHEIERLCHYHPAYMWLTGLQRISAVTLCVFRRTDPKALRQLFAEVLGVMAAKGLITLERVVQDGTKLQACASADTFRGQESIAAKIAEALRLVEALERQEEAGGGETVSPQKAAALRRQLQKRELAREELKKLRAVKAKKNKDPEEAKISLTDPEARIMKKPHGGYEPSYNGQIVVDSKAGMVVAAAISQSSSDAESLVAGLEQVEQNCGRKPEQVVVDGGYTTHSNIVEAKRLGVELYGSLGDSAARSAAGCKRWGISEEFRPEAFRYQEAENCFICPAGKTLIYRSRSEDELTGEVRHSYQAAAAECGACECKAQCCPKTNGGRTVSRVEMAPAVAELKARMETPEAKAIYQQRKQLIELVNGWLKTKLGLRQFRLQGLIKVGMELLWACLAYNIRIWIRLRRAGSPAPPG